MHCMGSSAKPSLNRYLRAMGQRSKEQLKKTLLVGVEFSFILVLFLRAISQRSRGHIHDTYSKMMAST
eukprot:scaffold45666_cov18-Tisochrysis_lutea.AAC.1